MGKAEYRLSPKAVKDLEDIWNYIADFNEAAADRLLDAIHTKITRALDFPLMGAARPSVDENARILVVDSYVIVYMLADYGLLVVTITHGRKPPELTTASV